MQSLLSNPEFPIFVLAGACLILVLAVLFLSRKLHRLMRGKDAASLEETILDLHQKLDELQEFQDESEIYFENVEARLRRSIQSIETIRFNPWKGQGEGGNQSFATALLNEQGDGVVFSSLFSRDRVSVFSKPIKGHSSEFDLSEEESEALLRSKNSVSVQKTLSQ